jgi:putative transposase
MDDITVLLQPIQTFVSGTVVRRLSRIMTAMLAMTGRVTMLGLSRWAGRGGSYRSVQRFFYALFPWAEVFWHFFRHHLWRPKETYLLAGDESMVNKAGKETFGLDRFFCALVKRKVPAISFFVLSLVSVGERHSFPLQVQQIVPSAEEKAASQVKAKAKKRPRSAPRRKAGRPLGCRTKSRTEIVLSVELQRIQKMVQSILQSSAGFLKLTYLLLDGHFGSNAALQMTLRCGLHLISKLRTNAALFFPYAGPQAKVGRRRVYGPQVNYRHLPERYLKATTVEEKLQTRIYQADLLHHDFSQPLNVVILLRTDLVTGASSYTLLFTSDLTLPYQQIVAYYALRFQIEFNFRDAKQYWGLEDFMNVTEEAVTNAANLALFMTNASYVLMCPFRRQDPAFSVQDLKAHYRGYKYAMETIKLLPEKPAESLISRIFRQMTGLGTIHPVKRAFCFT